MPYAYGPWMPGRSVHLLGAWTEETVSAPSGLTFTIANGAVPAYSGVGERIFQFDRTIYADYDIEYFPIVAPPDSDEPGVIYRGAPPAPEVVSTAWNNARDNLIVGSGFGGACGWYYEVQDSFAAPLRTPPPNGYLGFHFGASTMEFGAAGYSFFYPVGYSPTPGVTLEWDADDPPDFTSVFVGPFAANETVAGASTYSPRTRRFLTTNPNFGVDDPFPGTAGAEVSAAGSAVPLGWLNGSGLRGFAVTLLPSSLYEASPPSGFDPQVTAQAGKSDPTRIDLDVTFISSRWRTVTYVPPVIEGYLGAGRSVFS